MMIWTVASGMQEIKQNNGIENNDSGQNDCIVLEWSGHFVYASFFNPQNNTHN